MAQTQANKGTGAGLSKNLPAGSHILHSSMTVVQTATNGTTCPLNLKLSTAVQNFGQDVTGTELLAADLNVGTGGTVGASVAGNAAVVSTNVRVNVIHTGNTANVAAGDAKVLVTIVYAGKGEPAAA